MHSQIDCIFWSDGYCVHTDKMCQIKCKWAMKKYDGLDFSSHFQTYWKRRERYLETIFKLITITISVAALIVAFFAYVNSTSNVPPP